MATFDFCHWIQELFSRSSVQIYLPDLALATHPCILQYTHLRQYLHLFFLYFSLQGLYPWVSIHLDWLFGLSIRWSGRNLRWLLLLLLYQYIIRYDPVHFIQQGWLVLELLVHCLSHKSFEIFVLRLHADSFWTSRCMVDRYPNRCHLELYCRVILRLLVFGQFWAC